MRLEKGGFPADMDLSYAKFPLVLFLSNSRSIKSSSGSLECYSDISVSEFNAFLKNVRQPKQDPGPKSYVCWPGCEELCVTARSETVPLKNFSNIR